MSRPAPPPADIAPGKLWRSLLALPRPVAPIPQTLRLIPNVALYVRALSSREIGATFDTGMSRFQCEFIAAALCDDIGTPSFSSGAQVANLLTPGDAVALGDAVFAAQQRLFPAYIWSDAAAWSRALREGCVDIGNQCDATALGGCTGVSFGFGKNLIHVTEEPERWFGVPQNQLLDCHWFAYRAAMAFRVETQRRA